MNELKHYYTDTLHSKRIAVLGPLPPPLGGVAVHVQRVIAKLKAQGCTVFHFNTCAEYRYRYTMFYLMRLAFFLMFKRPEQVHLHTLYLSNGLRELALLMQLKKRLRFELILIEHDCRYLYTKDRAWKDRFNRLLLDVEKHVYIGNLTAQSFVENGITRAHETTTEGAFLPPDRTQEQYILLTYPKELFPFLYRHDTILLANAFALSLLSGKDLYGFDLCIKLVKALRKKGNNIGLVFVLGQIGDASYFDFCMHMIKQYGLQNHIFIVTGQKELWPLMKLADVFLRPTLSDGASVSIEEALWCGTPVIASDVCVRPKEVMLFKVGDERDLQKAVEKLLFATQSPVISQCDAKIDHISNQRCNNTSVDSANRNQKQI